MKISLIFFLLIHVQVLISVTPVEAGTTFSDISKSTYIFEIKNAEEMNRIIEQILEAKRTSQRALSKDEIEKIMKQAKEARENQAVMIVDIGAMVYTGCQIIEQEGKEGN